MKDFSLLFTNILERSEMMVRIKYNHFSLFFPPSSTILYQIRDHVYQSIVYFLCTHFILSLLCPTKCTVSILHLDDFSPIHLEGKDAHLKTTIPIYFILYIGYLLLDFLYV